MANNKFAIGLVIGGSVSSSVGAAFKDVEGRIGKLKKRGEDAKVLQSVVGETIRLREEWRKADAAGQASARGLRTQLDRNLDSLRKQGIEVDKLERHYRDLGRTARSAALQSKGLQQVEAGKNSLKTTVVQGAVGTAALAVPTKISADYQAIIRDIAIKAGVARKPEEAELSQSIVTTARDTGMGRNEVADVVNQLVGAGMDLKQAMSYSSVASKFVVGQGSGGVDTARMINALGQNAKITDPQQMQKALEAIAYQGQAGSFEASDMAKWFPELLAGMAKQGIYGMDAVTQLGSMLQVQIKSAGSADEAANNLKNWMEKIGSGETVKAYTDAGINYQDSLNTGLQKGMSTLESSFALAQHYIEKTDPKKAAAMAEATAKISKEADPAKAKQMMQALEESMRTGDLFADMQVKAALMAYMQNKDLYQQLKTESANAAGILDKNLEERRDASGQKWKEAGNAANDALRTIGDGLRPLTDAAAEGVTKVANGINKLSSSTPGLAVGIVGIGAGVFGLAKALGAFKLARGLINIVRGAAGQAGKDKDGKPEGVQQVYVTNQRGGAAGGAGKAKGSLALDVVEGGLKVLGATQDKPAEGEGGFDPVAAGLKAVEAVREAAEKREGHAVGEAAEGVQRVFVVNTNALGGPAPAEPPARRRGRRRGRRAGRVAPVAQAPAVAPKAVQAVAAAPKGVPSAVAQAVSAASANNLLGKAAGVAGKVGRFTKGVPLLGVLGAGLQVADTMASDQSQAEKAESYGSAAGGLAGGMAGAAAGAAIGSVVPVIGTAIGGLIGGILGSMGGDAVGSKIGRLFADDDEASPAAPLPDVGVPIVAAAEVAARPEASATAAAPAAVPAAAPVVVAPAAAPPAAPGAAVQKVVVPSAVPGRVTGHDGRQGPPERQAQPAPVLADDSRKWRDPVLLRALQGKDVQDVQLETPPAELFPRRDPASIGVPDLTALLDRQHLPGVTPAAVQDAAQLQQLLSQFQAPAVRPSAESVPADPGGERRIEQTVPININMPITVQGDVKDPQELLQQLRPGIQQLMEQMSRGLAERQLFDAPHV